MCLPLFEYETICTEHVATFFFFDPPTSTSEHQLVEVFESVLIQFSLLTKMCIVDDEGFKSFASEQYILGASTWHVKVIPTVYDHQNSPQNESVQVCLQQDTCNFELKRQKGKGKKNGAALASHHQWQMGSKSTIVLKKKIKKNALVKNVRSTMSGIELYEKFALFGVEFAAIYTVTSSRNKVSWDYIFKVLLSTQFQFFTPHLSKRLTVGYLQLSSHQHAKAAMDAYNNNPNSAYYVQWAEPTVVYELERIEEKKKPALVHLGMAR